MNTDPHFEETELFTSGAGGYHTYRIPALVVSTAETVLAFCEGRRDTADDFGKIDILLRRSNDAGRTWGDARIVVADGEQTCGNPCPTVDRHTGAVWLPFCKNSQEVFVTTSDDDGLRWSAPTDITDSVKDPKWSYVGCGPGHGIQLQTGRLLIPSWCDQSPGPVKCGPSSEDCDWGIVQSSYAFYSDDHGISWTPGEQLDHNLSDECMAIETQDGSVYMNMRSRQSRKRRAYSWSHDGGHTWEQARFDPSLPEPECQAGLVGLPDRSTDSGSAALISHPGRTDKRARMTVHMSRDGCRTWPVSKVLHEGQASYSDLAVVEDTQVLCLYECDQYSKIMLARFGLSWLTDETDHEPAAN